MGHVSKRTQKTRWCEWAWREWAWRMRRSSTGLASLAFVAFALSHCGADASRVVRLTPGTAGEVERVWTLVGTARTEEERTRGLRDYDPLSDDAALLIYFPATGEACITNAGVDYPIDIVFLGEDRHVLGAACAVPANAAGPWCQTDVAFVMEALPQAECPYAGYAGDW